MLGSSKPSLIDWGATGDDFFFLCQKYQARGTTRRSERRPRSPHIGEELLEGVVVVVTGTDEAEVVTLAYFEPPDSTKILETEEAKEEVVDEATTA